MNVDKRSWNTLSMRIKHHPTFSNETSPSVLCRAMRRLSPPSSELIKQSYQISIMCPPVHCFSFDCCCFNVGVLFCDVIAHSSTQLDDVRCFPCCVFQEKFSDDCLLKENLEENHYTTYSSHPGVYLALSHKGELRRGNSVSRHQSCTHFLPRRTPWLDFKLLHNWIQIRGITFDCCIHNLCNKDLTRDPPWRQQRYCGCRIPHDSKRLTYPDGSTQPGSVLSFNNGCLWCNVLTCSCC